MSSKTYKDSHCNFSNYSSDNVIGHESITKGSSSVVNGIPSCLASTEPNDTWGCGYQHCLAIGSVLVLRPGLGRWHEGPNL